jgi:hypothetical protein
VANSGNIYIILLVNLKDHFNLRLGSFTGERH